MYLAGKALFTGQGYTDIGMDHFALPTDELHTAWKNGELHRNFMGYTVQKSRLLLGLGMSAISDIGSAYAQNSKTIGGYYRRIESGTPAIEKGYFLSEEDKHMRKHILQLSCHGSTTWDESASPVIDEHILPSLCQLENDGLVTLRPGSLRITPLGRHFIRNICKTFDLHLLHKHTQQETQNRNTQQESHGLIFSKAI
jgi:oxygen-independent coproporphyrinogen-3 oxidase